MSDDVQIRRELRPGDYGAILELHGRIYPGEYGVDASFEAFVAASIARAALLGWPREREAIWMVEHEGEPAGSIGLTDEGDGVAMLRWFVLEPSLRGRGLGRRLVREVVATAREHGYELLRLETFSDLRAAAHLYREAGFEVVSSETGPRWGRQSITYQRYELPLVGGEVTPTTKRRVAGSV